MIGRATLYNADCRDVLPQLPLHDLLATDPPYGISKDGQARTTGGNGGRKAHEFKDWDAERPDRETFNLLLKSAPQAIIWGGNYFADLLPATGKWLVWDKGQRINQSRRRACVDLDERRAPHLRHVGKTYGISPAFVKRMKAKFRNELSFSGGDGK